MNASKKAAYSALVIAAYVFVVFLTQGFAFGAYQIRISTGFYALAYSNTFLIIPLGIGNMLSNILMGGLGLIDGFGGLCTGILTSWCVHFIGKRTQNALLVVLPIAIIPSVLVPIWLSPVLGIPYLFLVITVGIGQVVSAYTLGIFFVKSKVITHLFNNEDDKLK